MEFWDIYDINKKPTGRTMKRNDWCLKDGEHHLTVLGVVARPDGTFLITKRVMTKAWAPGWWEVSGGGVQAGDEGGGADAYAPGQSSSAEEEYPKVTSESEGEVEIDFTDTEKPQETPPPVPEGKTETEDSGEEHEVNPDPAVPEVTAPPAEESTSSNEPAPGSSNGSGAVYDPGFGWVVPGDVQQSTGDSDGDLNKQVGNMGG